MYVHAQSQIGAALVALAAFLPAAMSSSPAQAQQSAISIAAPRIDRFEVDPAARLVAGAELLFTLSGSPGGSAMVRI
ncbi:MAG TPA: hypothetical protein VKS43_08710 [Burkholderiales bacterium]|nr:hypothetical protein [Burkholderiales bacterium]